MFLKRTVAAILIAIAVTIFSVLLSCNEKRNK